MNKVEIMLDSENNKVVIIPDIIYKNKQNIIMFIVDVLLLIIHNMENFIFMIW